MIFRFSEATGLGILEDFEKGLGVLRSKKNSESAQKIFLENNDDFKKGIKFFILFFKRVLVLAFSTPYGDGYAQSGKYGSLACPFQLV